LSVVLANLTMTPVIRKFWLIAHQSLGRRWGVGRNSPAVTGSDKGKQH